MEFATRPHASTITSDRSRSDSNRSAFSVSSSTIQRHHHGHSRSSMSGTITPPISPIGEQTTFSSPDSIHHDRFVYYLRAFCAYHPAADPNAVTLPINVGDVIMIHSVHVNGWADGTSLNTGTRGWLPTNYCDPYDNAQVRPLLKALMNFWNVACEADDGNVEAFCSLDCLKGLVAGVRYTLEQTGCLSRTEPLVAAHANLSQCRKALLSELTRLVKLAKSLDAHTRGVEGLEVDQEILADILLRAYRVCLKVIKFHDMWSVMGIEDSSVFHVMPLTPPAENDHATFKQEHLATDQQQQTFLDSVQERLGQDSKVASPIAVETPFGLDRASKRMSQLRSHRISTLSMRQNHSNHRVSYSARSITIRTDKLASYKLDTSLESFKSVMGIFIGQHPAQRSSTEILITTQDSLRTGIALLKVVEKILERDPRSSESLENKHKDMYNRLTDMVWTARRVFDPSDDGSFNLEDQQSLAESALECMREASEHVQTTHAVLELIGDFEMDDSEVTEEIGKAVTTPAVIEEAPTAIPEENVAQAPEAAPHAEITLGPSFTESFSAAVPDFHAVTQDREAAQTPTNSAPVVDAEATPLARKPSQTTLDQPASAPVEDSTMSIGSISPAVTPRPISFLHSVADRLTGSRRASGVSRVPPPLPALITQGLPAEPQPGSSTASSSPMGSSASTNSLTRQKTNSVGHSSAISGTTAVISAQHSQEQLTKESSTTSEDFPFALRPNPSYDSISTAAEDDAEESEEGVLHQTFAHELMFNNSGQVTGGTVPALVEKLTAHDSTPDATFVAAFYLTFRLFVSPVKFATVLVERFQTVQTQPSVKTPVQLRVYNVFKGWLETHWRKDEDQSAWEIIVAFAKNDLADELPPMSVKLLDIANRAANSNGPLVPRQLAMIGRSTSNLGLLLSPITSSVPSPNLSKSQLNALKNWKNTGATVSIMDFEPLELARQLTIKKSNIFCCIKPEELLENEWSKKSGSVALNVRAMSTISTDLTHLVIDNILTSDDAQKRAKVIKHWIKVANKCLELHNYDSLIAICCALDATVVHRLKKTWDVVNAKAKATFQEMRNLTEINKNYCVLRAQMQKQCGPCLPFIGIYLTDLVFIDCGNSKTRQLQGMNEGDVISVVNFDKYIKTTRIIQEIQRFQVPYNLQEVPELQTWIQDQFVRVRALGENPHKGFYSRSLEIEPRDPTSSKASPMPTPTLHTSPSFSPDSGFPSISTVQTGKESVRSHKETVKDRLDIFSFNWAKPSNSEKNNNVNNASAVSVAATTAAYTPSLGLRRGL